MDIRTFEARTMKEALADVRAEMGPEAVILQSREVKRRRMLGLPAAPTIEITAGTGLAIAEKPESPNAANAQIGLDQIHDQLRSLHTMVEELCRRKKSPAPDLPDELNNVYTWLIDGEVHESIASNFVCRLRGEVNRPEPGQPGLNRARLGYVMP